MNMATAQPQQPVALTANQFLRKTKPKTVKVVSATPYVDGGTQSWQLPQAGLASMLWVTLQGSVTVAGTVSGGTFKTYPYPAPFSILKRIRFGSNNSFNMRDLTGWGWYKWVRYRYGLDAYPSSIASSFSANSTAALGLTGNGRITQGGNVAAGTYTFNLALPLPLAYNDQAETGLIILQQNSTFYNVTIDWGQITGGISATGGSNDLFAGLTGTGLTVTSSLTTTIGLEWYEFVAGAESLTSMFLNVNESILNPLVNGDNVFKLPVNDYYTMMLLEVVNNAAPVAVASIQNPLFQHSGNVYDYMDDYLTKLNMSRWRHDLPPMDGIIDWDFGIRQGVMKHRDAIDAFDNMLVTDAQLRFTLPGTLTVTGTNQATAVFESLRYIQQ